MDHEVESEVEDGIRVDMLMQLQITLMRLMDHFKIINVIILIIIWLGCIGMGNCTYIDKGFENIVIKEWQLFIDKQHLRDVIRDYCIQTGDLVHQVNKSWQQD